MQTWQWEDRNEGLFFGTETATKSKFVVNDPTTFHLTCNSPSSLARTPVYIRVLGSGFGWRHTTGMNRGKGQWRMAMSPKPLYIPQIRRTANRGRKTKLAKNLILKLQHWKKGGRHLGTSDIFPRFAVGRRESNIDQPLSDFHQIPHRHVDVCLRFGTTSVQSPKQGFFIGLSEYSM